LIDILKNWQGYAYLGGAVVLGLIAQYILLKILTVTDRRTASDILGVIARHCKGPLKLIIPLLVVHIFIPVIDFPENQLLFLKHILSLILIISVAWLAIRFAYIGEELIERRFQVDVKDNLQARRVHTQIQIFRKIAVVIITIVTLASILMTFERIRYLGTSILASAGIVGIIVGFAAQRSLGTLLAGIQIAVTQPIRIDDVVIVENEWGRIEEITLTYVVVRIWDLRRLIVPITYFMEKPFQNWTRVSADLLGTVYIYVDYTVPVQALRDELRRILESSDLWDGKVCGLQVTNASERTMELRALMSAADASAAWGLRCEAREKLIEFIRRQYPEALPRVRAEISGREGSQ